MRRIKDIVDVKKDILDQHLEVKVHNGNILLCDRHSGEAVKIGNANNSQIPIESRDSAVATASLSGATATVSLRDTIDTRSRRVANA